MSRAAGIDVSHWQTTTPDLAGLDFLIARVAYGTFLDAKYPMHRDNARRAGLVVGCYTFGRNQDGGSQADVMLRNSGDVELFVLDLESDGGNPRMTDDQAREFIRHIQADGKYCGLYHSRSGFPSLGQDWNWVASWTTTAPTVPWSIWQWQGSPLDRNWFNGTREQLFEFAGLVPPESGTVPPPGGTLEMEIPVHNLTAVGPGGELEIVGANGGLAIYTKTGQTLGLPKGLRKPFVATADLGPVTLPGGIVISGLAYEIPDQPAFLLERDIRITKQPIGAAPPPAPNEVAAYNQGVQTVKAAANAVPEK